LFGLWQGTAAAIIACSIGAMIMFFVARSTVGAALRRRLHPDGLIANMEAEVRRHAFSYLLTLRLIPGLPFALVNLVAGFVRMRPGTYMIATVLGVAPSSFIYAGVGSGLGALFDQGERVDMHVLLRPQVILPLCGLGALATVPHLVRFWRRGRKAAKDKGPAKDSGAPTAKPAAASGGRRPVGGRIWRPSWPGGLSARLLMLTALFVMLAELFILAPSLAAFEDDWLAGRVHDAELAALAVKASPAGVVSNRIAGELLVGAGVKSVAVASDGVQRLLLRGPHMTRTPDLVDLRRRNLADWLAAPFITLGPGEPRMLRVVARPQFSEGDAIDIVVEEAPLKSDLTAYMLRLLGVSALVSVIAGVLVYLTLNAFLVRPMQRITRAMERFRARPEDPLARLKLSGRRDEIGRAEAELDRMQEDLRTALQSRARLAALGEAVAKINHDLRNMLSSAQLVTERLARSGDPGVNQALPRLERALDRAVRLAENVLAYGKTEEPEPQKLTLSLADAAQAAADDAGLGPTGVALALQFEADTTIYADPDQLHRILVNLFRNAREAIEAARPRAPVGLICLTAETGASGVRLSIIDNGPGLPDRARARLFQAFAGSGRPGGAGLGLAIARELARAQSGDLELVETGPEGARFDLTLPPEPRPSL
jgi:signal transduction histidine kinase/membrane protein DedA with SNARE-associated domain